MSTMTADPTVIDNDVRAEAESLIVTASKNGGRIHRGTCKYLPKGAHHTADQWDADELAAAKRATCCSPSARLVEMYVDWRRATGTPAAPITDSVVVDVPDTADPVATIVAEEKLAAKRAAKNATPKAAAPTGDTQVCTGACGETKPLTSFPTVKPRKDGTNRGTECRKCRDARTAAKTS